MYRLHPYRKLRQSVIRRKQSAKESDRVIILCPFFISGESGESFMLGLGDVYITGAVLGSIAASVFGVIYGALRWNKDGEEK